MLRYLSLTMVLIFCSSRPLVLAQTRNATLHGVVTDPTGAVILGASISIITPDGKTIASILTDAAGAYQTRSMPPGTYIIVISAHGFAASSSKAVTLASGQSVQYSVALQIEVEQQDIQVDADAPTVDTNPDKNANAIVLKGKDLDALSDDPDELESELQALAGPSAGPNGGQLYVDGFTGGQIPPKSSIREIRINQNPFSAQFDRLGYGRIEIFTKTRDRQAPRRDRISRHGVDPQLAKSDSECEPETGRASGSTAQLLFLQCEWEHKRPN